MVDVFIDTNFLYKLSTKWSVDKINKDAFSKYLKMEDFIRSKHIRTIDLSTGFEYQKCDLTRQFFDPNCIQKLKPQKLDCYKFEHDNPFSIFFIDTDKAKIVEYSGKYSNLFFNYEELLFDWNRVFDPSSIPINSKTVYTEFINEFENIKHPFHSIIIMDRYLLSQDENTFKRNIVKYIKSMIRRDKNKSIYFTFICKNEIDRPKSEPEKLESIIRNEFKKYDIHIQIILIKSGYVELSNFFHDRLIITNFFRLSSLHSLDFFKDEMVSSKNTEVNVNSILKEKEYNITHNKLIECSKLLTENKSHLRIIGEDDLQMNPLLRENV